MAGSPILVSPACTAPAAIENFLVLENHSVDVPTWGDIVDGLEKPIVNRGFTAVPDGPGLGLALNEEALKKQIRDGGYFDPTPEWVSIRAHR